MSRFARIVELRRALPLVAAVLLVASIALPMWRITLTAPQYMEALVVEVYAYPRLGGDYLEVQTLNRYVGFYYPDPVFLDPNYTVNELAIAAPEWAFGPLAFVGLAIAAAVVALLPGERRVRRGLTALAVGTVGFLAVTVAIIQYRLYQAGHTLDPHAPLRGVDAFTPPIFGGYQVANISGFAAPGPGGYLVIVAAICILVAFAFRGSTATVRDLPTLLGELRRRIARRISRPPANSPAGQPAQRDP